MVNTDNSIDLAGMALQLGATFVARSFSGDKGQLVPIIRAAIEHEGAAFIDVISPCVAFNNHAGSTKSFDYVREHNEAVNRLDFISGARADHGRLRPKVRSRSSSSMTARRLALRKLGADYDLHNRYAAMNYLTSTRPRARSSPACCHRRDPQDLHHALRPWLRRSTRSGKRSFARARPRSKDQRVAALT